MRSLLLVAVLSIGCASAPDPEARTTLVAPDRASFESVSLSLERRCGSLDCHGHPARNFQLHGQYGLRSVPRTLPDDPGTTAAERESNYRSLVGLEPELLSAVVLDHGASPERLTFIRKARGSEDHKGGALMNVGDAEDRCLTSWLAGSLDAKACADAVPMRQE